MNYLFTQPYNLSRVFEQQFNGVMVQGNRPKGGGKGSAPKDMTVASMEEAAMKKCEQALKGMDVSTEKKMEMEGRHLNAVVGPGGSNARKLEQDYPGLYVVQNRGELIL